MHQLGACVLIHVSFHFPTKMHIMLVLTSFRGSRLWLHLFYSLKILQNAITSSIDACLEFSDVHIYISRFSRALNKDIVFALRRLLNALSLYLVWGPQALRNSPTCVAGRNLAAIFVQSKGINLRFCSKCLRELALGIVQPQISSNLTVIVVQGILNEMRRTSKFTKDQQCAAAYLLK